MRNIGRSGMIVGFFALVLAVGGAAVVVGYAIAGGGQQNSEPKPPETRGLVSSTLGF